MPYKILVCGGRDYTSYSTVLDTLQDIVVEKWSSNSGEEIIIIQGGAKGADFLAKVFVLDEYLGHPFIDMEEYPADWKKFGKRAGMIRNQQMLDEGQPDLVVAFPGGSGTKDMVERAKKAGVKVIEVEDAN